MSIDIKERLQAVIDMYPDGTRGAGMRNTLIAILADMEREDVPKPTGEPDETKLQHALDTIASIDRECSLCQPYLTLPDRVQGLIYERADLPDEPKAEPELVSMLRKCPKCGNDESDFLTCNNCGHEWQPSKEGA